MKTLIDKPAREIKSTPIGRDRFGVSYWLFMVRHQSPVSAEDIFRSFIVGYGLFCTFIS